MKTSFKLLLGLLLVLIVTMFGTAVSLRKQYDSIDKKDVYSRWKAVSLPAFRAVTLIGPTLTTVQVKPGNTTRLLIDTLQGRYLPTYTYRVERDTLFMTLGMREGWTFRPEDDDDDLDNAHLLVEVPTLTGVTTVNANCQITDYKGDALTIRQDGAGGRTGLKHVTCNQLMASLAKQNQLTIAPLSNRIGRATITLADSARLHQYSDFEQGLTLKASPGASLRLTGKAMAQAQQ